MIPGENYSWAIGSLERTILRTKGTGTILWIEQPRDRMTRCRVAWVW
jgi:hypothetical protein